MLVSEKARSSVVNRRKFRLIYICTGGIIQNSIITEWYQIHQISNNGDYMSINKTINKFLKKYVNSELPYNPMYEQQHKSYNPIFCIDFHKVIAIDENDAYFTTQNWLKGIINIIGLNNGYKPYCFFSWLNKFGESKCAYKFDFNGYKGNIVEGFNPQKLKDNLRNFLLPVSNSPYASMILNDYASALNEENYDIRFLRFWTIIESIAKRKITNSTPLFKVNGNQLNYENGGQRNSADTLGKVYLYYFNKQMDNHTISAGDFHTVIFNFKEFEIAEKPNQCFDLWETICFLNTIRNAIAHDGHYDLDTEKLSSNTLRVKVSNIFLECKFAFMGIIESLSEKAIYSDLNNL